jgi:hypothetical protein
VRRRCGCRGPRSIRTRCAVLKIFGQMARVCRIARKYVSPTLRLADRAPHRGSLLIPNAGQYGPGCIARPSDTLTLAAMKWSWSIGEVDEFGAARATRRRAATAAARPTLA